MVTNINNWLGLMKEENSRKGKVGEYMRTMSGHKRNCRVGRPRQGTLLGNIQDLTLLQARAPQDLQ